MIVGRKGLTPQRFYGYSFSNFGFEKLNQKEIDSLKKRVLKEKETMATVRGKFKGNFRLN